MWLLDCWNMLALLVNLSTFSMNPPKDLRTYSAIHLTGRLKRLTVKIEATRKSVVTKEEA